MSDLLKCLRCSGTGWRTPPPREPDDYCPACNGSGEVPDTHKWAGYCASYDYTRGGRG